MTILMDLDTSFFETPVASKMIPIKNVKKYKNPIKEPPS